MGYGRFMDFTYGLQAAKHAAQAKMFGRKWPNDLLGVAVRQLNALAAQVETPIAQNKKLNMVCSHLNFPRTSTKIAAIIVLA